MNTSTRTWVPVTMAALLAIAGCSSSDDAVAPGLQDTQAGVQEAAPVAAIAGPDADAASALAAAMIGQITPAAAARGPLTGAASPAGSSSLAAGTAGASGASVVPPQCPAEFDLGNGITGTCSVADDGTITFNFGGTKDVHGFPTTISGTMTAIVVGPTPAGGSIYNVALSATAVNVNGSASWNVSGQIVTGANAQVVDFTMNHAMSVTPTGASTRIVSVHSTPTDLEVTRVGPNGHVVKFDLDRTTMTGTVQLDGHLVANVTIADGCASIDYVNPALTDETICSQQAS